jgi:hypothetical protein
MTTLTIDIPNDARAMLEISARAHGVSLPLLIKKAIAVYAAAVLENERREPKKLGQYQ